VQWQRRDQDDRTGIGDLYVAPIQLNWHWADHHLTFSHGVYLPTGSHDRKRVINLGRNYWNFDSNLTYTWLSQTRGHEVTFNAGYLLNTRNTASDYVRVMSSTLTSFSRSTLHRTLQLGYRVTGTSR
jgi:hypothetical protein